VERLVRRQGEGQRQGGQPCGRRQPSVAHRGVTVEPAQPVAAVNGAGQAPTGATNEHRQRVGRLHELQRAERKAHPYPREGDERDRRGEADVSAVRSAGGQTQWSLVAMPPPPDPPSRLAHEFIPLGCGRSWRWPVTPQAVGHRAIVHRQAVSPTGPGRG
jgi:hypothetical protein